LANCLEISDNFVVNVEEWNQDDVDIYVVLAHNLYMLWRKTIYMLGVQILE
jgi:hypothetical protein